MNEVYAPLSHCGVCAVCADVIAASGVYGVTSTKRQPGYTNLTFQMGPRLKRSESIRSATSVVKKKELQAKASINIQSQSSSKRGQV